jgi:hypothetical protein
LNASSPDYQDLVAKVQQSASLKSLYGIEDVVYILNALCRIHQSALVAKADHVIIAKGCFNFITIVVTENGTSSGKQSHSGRSIHIDMSLLRVLTKQRIEENKPGFIIRALVWAAAAALCIGAQYTWNYKPTSIGNA